MWALETLQMTVWFNPQLNPRGNWMLVKKAAEKFGVENIDMIMPPEPPAIGPENDMVKGKWAQLMQGEFPEVKKTDDAMTLYAGIMAKKEENKGKIDEEVEPTIDAYLFHLSVAMLEQVKATYQSMMANQLAMRMIQGPQAPQQPMGPQNTMGQQPGPTGQPAVEPTPMMGADDGINEAGRAGSMAQSV
jgi:hypothetical protein